MIDWGKIVYVFFALMSVTTTIGFLYDQHEMALFIAMSVNLISTWLKIGVNNMLASELLATSLVADLHLIPAVFLLSINHNLDLAYALSLGALAASLFALVLIVIETSKAKTDEDAY